MMADIASLALSQLTVLPSATHVTLIEPADWLFSMAAQFFAAPEPKARQEKQR